MSSGKQHQLELTWDLGGLPCVWAFKLMPATLQDFYEKVTRDIVVCLDIMLDERKDLFKIIRYLAGPL